MTFHCKGNVYLGLFESLRTLAIKEEVCARIESTSLRAFAMQPFLMASWYDIEPILALGETGARITGKPYADFMRSMAVDQANRDVGGVYRVLLKLASPSAVVDRLPRVANRYFDFVRSVLLTPGERLPGRTCCAGPSAWTCC